MLKVALRGLLARKFRLALTATAVLLGVMFVTTTYVLTDTLDESFDRVFAQSLSDVDMVVRGAPVRGDDNRARIPQSAVEEVRGIDGVATAHGFVQGYATLGAIGYEGRWDYACIGSVSNLAARLCNEAKGGQIVTNQKTLAGIEDSAQAELLGDLMLKGIAHPVQALNITGFNA